MRTEQGKPLVNVPQMPDDELRRVLEEWNDTFKEYPGNVCLHQLFELQVKQTPNNTAIVYEGNQLTYNELNRRANQMAHYLRGLGVGPEVLVGVYMERSIEMVVSIYGILKAGGAYVPLDPEYPEERLSFMLEDTMVPVILTQSGLDAEMPDNGAELICVDRDWPVIAKESADNSICRTTAENLAYVIYTSGSTGRPKGVMNCHRGIYNRILWMQDTYKLTESDRVLQKTPFSFDVSVWEFFWPLTAGARLIVAMPKLHKDSTYLVGLITEQEVTTLHFVPTMLQIFLDDIGIEKCTSLKRVFCSGEALSYELQERFFAAFDAELHNLYGPTEAAVDVTYWACQKESDEKIVPIGMPVANTQIYVLDQNKQPIPLEAHGELYIGGVQVARGYLNRPELTAERFITDPFSDKPGARMYKTGDLACYLPNGALKYIGRADQQVKIHGVRIELGEIEFFLEELDDIKQTAVIVREDEPGDRRLVAYLVPHKGKQPVITALRLYLQEKLPDAMIPAAFMVLEAMPLLPNGKIDRQTLPPPGRERHELGQEYVPPKTRLELYLAGIWREVLKLDRIGIHDRFFELGGDSIKAAQFINKLQKDLGVNIYIVSIFEAPSISAYSAFLQKDYADVVIKKFGFNKVSGNSPRSDLRFKADGDNLDREAISRMRACIPQLQLLKVDESSNYKNPPAIFILAPPRSGTTLLRVMLAGHPELFAAAELQLLCFNTLDERLEAFSGKFSLWLEGTIKTIMETKNCGVDEANRIMEECEQNHYTTKQFYRKIQNWIGNKTLVDKSPSYVLDPNTLEKAELDFNNALYIHLVRHPYSMVSSFTSYHMDQVLFLKDHMFSPRQLGELVWFISHDNTLQFLKKIPKHRKYQILFEDLVDRPKQIMEEMCQTLGLSFHTDLIKPYKDIDKKMTDGLYKDSRPMGDTKFLNHQRIDPKVAESWKGIINDNFLSDITWELASSFGYESPGITGISKKDKPDTGQKQPAGRQRDFLEQRRNRRKEHRDNIRQGE